jgi:malate synthase
MNAQLCRRHIRNPARALCVERAAQTMLKAVPRPMTHRLLTPAVAALTQALCDHFGARRTEVLAQGGRRIAALREGHVARLEETAHIRNADWTVDPVPAELLERRVELIGGCMRKEIIQGMNAGAKSYVADLRNMTLADPQLVLQAHANIERAADNRLAYVDVDGDRIRINPHSTTRLMLVPRALSVMETHDRAFDAPVPACFLDLALHVVHNSEKLRLRQGGIYLYLREVGGHLEARLWNDVFAFIEDRSHLPQGSIRATVIMDSLAAALEADEILFELMHHSSGLSLDHQAYAADHVALFGAPDRPSLPDREHIGLNAHFLRSVSLLVISLCHRRQAHAIGAPSFVMPPEHGPGKPIYLEMIADKEREAVDGHDGTLVAHPGLVNAAMAEFNKSMPRAHQMYYQRPDRSTPADLVQRPEGPLSTAGIIASIRTVLRALVGRRNGNAIVAQGGRLHDRSSVRLSTLLLWQWTRAESCFITETGLEVHEDLMKFLIRKEGEKLFPRNVPELHEPGQEAVRQLTNTVLSHEVPQDLLDA